MQQLSVLFLFKVIFLLIWHIQAKYLTVAKAVNDQALGTENKSLSATEYDSLQE